MHPPPLSCRQCFAKLVYEGCILLLFHVRVSSLLVSCLHFLMFDQLLFVEFSDLCVLTQNDSNFVDPFPALDLVFDSPPWLINI